MQWNRRKWSLHETAPNKVSESSWVSVSWYLEELEVHYTGETKQNLDDAQHRSWEDEYVLHFVVNCLFNRTLAGAQSAHWQLTFLDWSCWFWKILTNEELWAQSVPNAQSNNNMTKETAYGGDVKPWQGYATGVVEEDDFFYCFSHKNVEATESGMNLSWPQETAVEPEWSFGNGKYFKLSVHHTHVHHVGGKPSHLRVRGGRSVQRVHSTFAPAPAPTASWRGWWSL